MMETVRGASYSVPQMNSWGGVEPTNPPPMAYPSATPAQGQGYYITSEEITLLSTQTITEDTATWTTLTTVTTVAESTSTSTLVAITSYNGVKVSQGAIIAISIICGLLLLALLLGLVAIIGRRYRKEQLSVQLAGAAQGHHHRRRHRSSHRSSGTYSTDGTEYGLNPNIMGLAGMGGHGRAGYPVPRRTGPDRFMPGPGVAGRSAEAYGQFGGPGVFLRPGPVKGRSAPIVPQSYHPNPHYPNIEDPQGAQEVRSGGSVIDELSEEGSSRSGGRKGASRTSSRKRRHSKCSSSHARGHGRG
jgi:hypothetical protein